MALTEQREAVELAKNAGPETSNDQQTPPLLAKKPWWSMVVGSGGKSGLIGVPFGRQGGARTASNPGPSSHSQQQSCRGEKRPVARVSAQVAAKQSHVRLTRIYRPVARQARTGRRSGASPARQNSKPSSGALLNIRK